MSRNSLSGEGWQHLGKDTWWVWELLVVEAEPTPKPTPTQPRWEKLKQNQAKMPCVKEN